MFDAIVGLFLVGLGLKKTIPPSVLGDHDETEQSSGSTGSSQSNSGSNSSGSTGASSSTSGSSHEEDDDSASGSSSSTGASSQEAEHERERRTSSGASEGLRVMQPKFTPEQQEAFQKEREKRAENLKKISEERVKKLEATFAQKQKDRKEKDKATRDTLAAKVREFKNIETRTKLLSISEKYQKAVTNTLSAMQKKLQSMLTLLDKVSAAAGALKAQGTDVSVVESDVATAQTKVNAVVFQVNTLVDSLPTAFSVSTEAAVKSDVEKAISSTRSQIEAVRTAFKEAHASVEKAVEDLEELTNVDEVGTLPEKK